jgi:hypothetical protein
MSAVRDAVCIRISLSTCSFGPLRRPSVFCGIKKEERKKGVFSEHPNCLHLGVQQLMFPSVAVVVSYFFFVKIVARRRENCYNHVTAKINCDNAA